MFDNFPSSISTQKLKLKIRFFEKKLLIAGACKEIYFLSFTLSALSVNPQSHTIFLNSLFETGNVNQPKRSISLILVWREILKTELLKIKVELQLFSIYLGVSFETSFTLFSQPVVFTL